MRTLYLVSVWLHIVAAIVWIGGMFFLVLVVVPWMRAGNQAAGARLLRETGVRFSRVGWGCFALALLTGAFNLWVRGVRLASFTEPAFCASGFGQAVILKLAVFAAVLVCSGVHDFVVGPRAVDALMHDPESGQAQRLRRQASLLGRVNAVLALALLVLAVVLVRGWP